MEASLQIEDGFSVKLQEASLLLHKQEAPSNLEEVTEEAESGEETFVVLQMAVDELQESFDKYVMEKYSLAHTCQQLMEKLKSANYLLDRSVSYFYFLYYFFICCVQLLWFISLLQLMGICSRALSHFILYLIRFALKLIKCYHCVHVHTSIIYLYAV